jgi:hypothetical protein
MVEVKVGKCRGEVVEHFEDVQRVVILFYCYKCRKIHELCEEEDWLNGLILARLS